MFDGLVQELTSRFDLGGKAAALVRGVLTYIFQEEPGGASAFLDRFRREGLGDLVNSWVGGSNPRELTTGQLEGALGASLLERLAGTAGLSVAKAKAPLAMLVPSLIAMLTADGKVPRALPPAVSSWLGGPVKTGVYQAEPVREPARAAAAPSVWTWLLPLLGLGALALLWFLWPTTRTVTPTATTQPAPTPVPTAASVPAITEPWPVKIYFTTDSKTLGAEDSARVQRAADYLKANPAAVVDITGFTDKTGGAAANEELAKERAKTVRGTLVAAGVPESRTNLAPPAGVTGGGSSAEARRVEISLKR